MEAEGKHNIFARPTSMGRPGSGNRVKIHVKKSKRKDKMQEDNVADAPNSAVSESVDDGFNNYSNAVNSSQKKFDLSHRKGGQETVRALHEE